VRSTTLGARPIAPHPTATPLEATASHCRHGHADAETGAAVTVRGPDAIELQILRLRLLVDGARTEWRGPHELLVRGVAVERVGDLAAELGVPLEELCPGPPAPP
jgi:hypothetical protein